MKITKTYTLLGTTSTVHVAGVSCGDGESTMNACGSLTRSGHKMREYASDTDLAALLERAKGYRRNLCKTCEKAALAELASVQDEIVSSHTEEDIQTMRELKTMVDAITEAEAEGSPGDFAPVPGEIWEEMTGHDSSKSTPVFIRSTGTDKRGWLSVQFTRYQRDRSGYLSAHHSSMYTDVFMEHYRKSFD